MSLGARRVRGRCVDISLSGMALTLPGTLSAGDYVRINLELPSPLPGGCRPPIDLTMDGVVARVGEGSAHHKKVGIEFTVMEVTVASAISNFVAEHSADALETLKTRKYVAIREAITAELSPVDADRRTAAHRSLEGRARELEALYAETHVQLDAARKRRRKGLKS